jgi:hypothetical protein
MSEEERREEQRSLLRHALEQVVDELGERLRTEAIELPAGAISAVSEALTAAYVRGMDHGMRQAARDLEERMAELGVAVQAIIDDPPSGAGGAPPASGA